VKWKYLTEKQKQKKTNCEERIKLVMRSSGGLVFGGEFYFFIQLGQLARVIG
jgi:hypothetical protein